MYIKDLLTVAKHISNTLAAPGNRVTTSDVYNAVKANIVSDIDEVTFKTALSTAIKSKTIGGLLIKKGRFGGIFLDNREAILSSISKLEAGAENAPPPEPKTRKPRTVKTEETPEETTEEDITEDYISSTETDRALDIRLSKTLRLCAPDKYNWALQKLIIQNGEEIWQSFAYWSTLDQALNGVAKKILDSKLRLSDGLVVDLRGVAGVVNNAKNEILNEIKSCIDNSTKVE